MEIHNYPEKPFLEVNYPGSMDASYNNRYASNSSTYRRNDMEDELFQAQNNANRLSSVVFQLESRIEELEYKITDLEQQLKNKQSEVNELKTFAATQQEVKVETKTSPWPAEVKHNSISKPSYLESNTCL